MSTIHRVFVFVLDIFFSLSCTGGNILLTPEGIVKLADFGASKKLQDIRTYTDNHAAGTMTGTPYWMAPEVIRGNMNYGRKADLWSLGICVIEMATGKPPYSDLGPVTALFKIGSTDQPPPFPPSLSATGKDFLSSCLSRDPKCRPSAEELMVHPWVADVERKAQKSSNRNSVFLEESPSDTIAEYLELSKGNNSDK